MSAIAGLVALDRRPVAATDVELMVESMAHRGTDGRRVWVEGDAGLGHCMLHTTPESLTERLPLRRGELTITADARLDNRAELIRALEVSNGGGSPSDSELIVESYLRWGEDCPSHLLGDFAFAIWDSTRRELFCARDHLGIRPFYYFHQAGRRFVFGTEIKSIFSLADVSRRLNEAKIADYMLASFEDKARTFYLDINRLPPASTLTIGQGGLRIRQYWALEPEREIRLKSDDEYAEAYRHHFVEAVRCRLRSAFPVGSMLSGGLDSSSIACVANAVLDSRGGDRLHTFSIVFDKICKSDERHHIDSVLSGGRFAPHLIDGDPVTPLDDLDAVLWHQDEPFYAPNLSLTRQGWQSARSNGVRVLLDGLFGDNVVSHGIEHLRALANRWRVLALAKELRALIRQSGRSVPVWDPLRRYLVNDGVKPYVPEAALRALRRLRNAPVDPVSAQCAIFQADYCDRAQLRTRLARALEHDRTPRSPQQSHSELLGCGMVQTALEVYDRGCGEFALETRFPFLDRRLVEYCVAIPGDQKVRDGYTRLVARRALQGYLPEEIRWRSDKGDLGWSFRGGFRSRQDLVQSTLASAGPFLGRYLDTARVERLRDRLQTQPLVDDEVMNLFLAVVLSAWHSRSAEPAAA